MSINRTLLYVLRDRGKYNLLKGVVPDGDGMLETKVILSWYGKFFKANPNAETVNFEGLKDVIRLKASSDPSQQALVDTTVALVDKVMNNPPTLESQEMMLQQLQDILLSAKVTKIQDRYESGDEVDLAFEIQQAAQEAIKASGQQSAHDYEQTPIQELLEEAYDDTGLKFTGIPALEHGLQGILPGISIAIAARPDKGKSSFVAWLLTRFAPQAAMLWGTDRPILWLNNEGKGRRLIPRIYQAALSASVDDLHKWSKDGSLQKRYEAAIGAPSNFIRIKDMHGANMGQIERVIDAVKPSVVVADMLSNFNMGQSGMAAHAEVEKVWEVWREILARHDCIGIGTIQISQEGANMLYPPQSALKESKTGVQGAVDLILMLGNFDHESPELRGISTPKNKLQRPNAPGYLKFPVVFDPVKCQFLEAE